MRKLDIHMQKKKKKNEVRLYLTSNTKITSKWILNLNIRAKTVKLFEKYRGKAL